MKYPTQKLDKEWISSDVPLSKDVIMWSNSFGLFLSQGENNINAMSTNQLRKFFGEIKKIEANYGEYSYKIPLLMPKLAYAVGKSYNNKKQRSDNKIQEFYEEIQKAIDACHDKASFSKFVDLIESIVAFKKFHDK